LFQNSHIYVITDPEIIITDNLNVIYQVNIPKGNAKNCCIFRVSQFAYEGINFGAVGGSKAKKQGIDQKFNIK
jgi:hypothetical protein